MPVILTEEIRHSEKDSVYVAMQKLDRGQRDQCLIVDGGDVVVLEVQHVKERRCGCR